MQESLELLRQYLIAQAQYEQYRKQFFRGELHSVDIREIRALEPENLLELKGLREAEEEAHRRWLDALHRRVWEGT